MLWLEGILFVALLLLGIPVGLTLIALSAFYVIFNPSILDVVLAQRLVNGTQSFPLLAVPLFIFVGQLMNISGVSRRVMDFASIVTARVWGGIAQTNVMLSALLAGMSGSANGDAAMQAKILVPEMTRRGYPLDFSVALTTVTALIAPMIPPGIGLILFGFVTNTSIGAMFAGAIVPGVMLAVLLSLQTYVMCRRNRWDPPKEDRSPQIGRLRTFVQALPAMILPIFIILGIRMGAFTPAEAAAVAVIYSMGCVIAYRETNWREIIGAIRSTVSATAAILLILAASAAFSWILTYERIPQQVAEAMLSWTDSPFLMLSLIALLVLVLGMFIEGTALILILAPIFLPVASALHIDPVHYGVVFVLMAHLGGITPPVGTIMFTTCAITGLPIAKFAKAISPFIASYLLFALIIIAFPVFCLGLLGL